LDYRRTFSQCEPQDDLPLGRGQHEIRGAVGVGELFGFQVAGYWVAMAKALRKNNLYKFSTVITDFTSMPK
jgi:hypothetical protein